VLAGHPPLRPAWLGLGPKPIPADGQPVLGALGEVEGLYVAFTHSGATLALIAGELLAAQILTGSKPPLLAPFGAERFG
jgi:glycine/D-amino acid oxidase-like deaminating enzyme